METRGLSQKEAAEKFGVSITTISRCLAGKRKVSKWIQAHIERKTAGAIKAEDWPQ
jgi:transposase